MATLTTGSQGPVGIPSREECEKAQPASRNAIGADGIVVQDTVQSVLMQMGQLAKSVPKSQLVTPNPPSYQQSTWARSPLATIVSFPPPGLQQLGETRFGGQVKENEFSKRGSSAQTLQKDSFLASKETQEHSPARKGNQGQGGYMAQHHPQLSVIPSPNSLFQHGSPRPQLSQSVSARRGAQAHQQPQVQSQSSVPMPSFAGATAASSQIPRPLSSAEMLIQPCAKIPQSASPPRQLPGIPSKEPGQQVAELPQQAVANLVAHPVNVEQSKLAAGLGSQTNNDVMTISRQTTASASDSDLRADEKEERESTSSPQPHCLPRHPLSQQQQQGTRCKKVSWCPKTLNFQQADELEVGQAASLERRATSAAAVDLSVRGEGDVLSPNENVQAVRDFPTSNNLQIMLYKPAELVITESISRYTSSNESCELTSPSSKALFVINAEITKEDKQIQKAVHMSSDDHDTIKPKRSDLILMEPVVTVVATSLSVEQVLNNDVLQETRPESQPESTSGCDNNLDLNCTTRRSSKAQINDKIAQQVVVGLRRPRKRLGWFECRDDYSEENKTINNRSSCLDASNVATSSSFKKVLDNDSLQEATLEPQFEVEDAFDSSFDMKCTVGERRNDNASNTIVQRVIDNLRSPHMISEGVDDQIVRSEEYQLREDRSSPFATSDSSIASATSDELSTPSSLVSASAPVLSTASHEFSTVLSPVNLRATPTERDAIGDSKAFADEIEARQRNWNIEASDNKDKRLCASVNITTSSSVEQVSHSDLLQEARTEAQLERENVCDDSVDLKCAIGKSSTDQTNDTKTQQGVVSLKRPHKRLGWFEHRTGDPKMDEKVEDSASPPVASNGAAPSPASGEITISSSSTSLVVSVPSTASPEASIVFSIPNLRSTPMENDRDSHGEASSEKSVACRRNGSVEAIEDDDELFGIQENGSISALSATPPGGNANVFDPLMNSAASADTLTPFITSATSTTSSSSYAPSDFHVTSIRILVSLQLSPVSDRLDSTLWPMTPICWEQKEQQTAPATLKFSQPSAAITSSTSSVLMTQSKSSSGKRDILSNTLPSLLFPTFSSSTTTRPPNTSIIMFSLTAPASASVMSSRKSTNIFAISRNDEMTSSATTIDCFIKGAKVLGWSIHKEEAACAEGWMFLRRMERRDDDHHHQFAIDPGVWVMSSGKELLNSEEDIGTKHTYVSIQRPGIRPPPEPPPMAALQVAPQEVVGVRKTVIENQRSDGVLLVSTSTF